VTKHPLVPSDLYGLVTASDPRCAPDGTVYFVRAIPDEPADTVARAIWRATPGSHAQQFTSGPTDGMPRLSSDGALLAFVRGAERKRICVMATAGGEAHFVGPEYDSIVALAWSPAAAELAFVAKAPHDPATARVAHDERSGARHIRALPFKSDDAGLLDGTRVHLFVVRADGDAAPAQITHGDFDVQTPAWSPDGKQLAFAAQRDVPETSFFTDIFVVDRDGANARKLTNAEGPMAAPAFSRDGTRIAFTGHRHGDDPSGRIDKELLVVATAGGAIASLSERLGHSLGDWIVCDTRGLADSGALAWSPDDREILAQATDGGRCSVLAFSADGSGVRTVVGGDRDVAGFSLGASGALGLAWSDPLTPSEVSVLTPAGEERSVGRLNAWLDEVALRAPRRVAATGADGTPLEAWVLDAQPAGGPLVLEVHGGPHTAYGYAFFFEFQMLASHGISVAYGNPRGSQGYGTAFADAITGNWGGDDAADVEAILDAVLASGSYDTTRIGLAGGSYGGFMTTWLLGRSKRFAAGVSMRAVNDFGSEAGASDLGWFLEKELAAPWVADAGMRLFERSPMRRAHEIEAPLLVEHSERDYRCPIDQGEQLFTLLRRLGKTVEFVRFTGDGHNLGRSGKPRNRVLRLRSIAHWFIRHLRPQGVAPVADTAGALFAPLSTEPQPAD